jgi:hypothetical protein
MAVAAAFNATAAPQDVPGQTGIQYEIVGGTLKLTGTSPGGRTLTSSTDWSSFGVSSIEIGAGITTIASSAFFTMGTQWLTSVTFSSGDLTTIANIAFYQCSNLTSVTFSVGIQSIGVNAFANTGLTSITIPNTVESLGANVFSNCTNLSSVRLPKKVLLN